MIYGYTMFRNALLILKFDLVTMLRYNIFTYIFVVLFVLYHVRKHLLKQKKKHDFQFRHWKINNGDSLLVYKYTGIICIFQSRISLLLVQPDSSIKPKVLECRRCSRSYSKLFSRETLIPSINNCPKSAQGDCLT